MRKRRLQLAFTSFAVFLLLAQLVLTAGHLHLHGPSGWVGSVATTLPGSDDAPAHPLDGDDEDHCRLCWAQAAAGHLLTPAPLALPLPAALAGQPVSFFAPHLTDRAIPSAFRPRAPPVSPV
jgi:hypothetical protein